MLGLWVAAIAVLLGLAEQFGTSRDSSFADDEHRAIRDWASEGSSLVEMVRTKTMPDWLAAVSLTMDEVIAEADAAGWEAWK